MPRHLRRFHNTDDYHLITFSCDRRLPYLAETDGYAVFESVYETFRNRYSMSTFGYVLMPEHVHLLVRESPDVKLSTALAVIKQQTSRKLICGRRAFWEERYHDVNLFQAANAGKALKYIHRNPVVRGLVQKPEEWPWSSFCHYLTGVPGTIQIESWWLDMARKRTSNIAAPE